MNYAAPVAEIAFLMKGIGDISEVAPDLSADTFAQILEEAGRFAAEVLEPIDKIGDRQGPAFDPATATVTTPYGWKPAWKVFAEAGWIGLSAPQASGGQGLPVTLQISVEEIWNAANPSFAVGAMLTQNAIHTLAAHATDPSIRPTIERLVDGTWTATMNLTEQASGSDLSGLRATAVPNGDGTYRISGVKIFITYGEHDLAGNIVHLVLARLPDAPAGTRGISLFLVPKFLPDSDGAPTVRNAVRAIGVERKLGLHGSPTCTMAYDGATGFLVGEANRGLAAMFTMMNLARLSVGTQGVGVAERAYQEALAYARERRQGRAPGWTGEGMSPIILHPDVAAMLLRMKSLTAGARALTLLTAHALDLSQRAADPAERKAAADRASLLTPLAKAFPTDAAIEVANLGIQVHGGAGFIEETGAAQRLRDARIFAIYEGTNGIQAIDLVTRKLKLDAAFDGLVGGLAATARATEALNRPDLGRAATRLAAALDDLDVATAHLRTALASGREREALAGATPCLRLLALATAAGTLLRAALATPGDAAGVATARHFAETVLVETAALRLAVIEGAAATEAVAAAGLAPFAGAPQRP